MRIPATRSAAPAITLGTVLCLGACSEPPQSVEIEFAARLGPESLDCERDNVIELTDLRFYISEPALVNADGQSIAIDLVENGRWQQRDLALIDLENAAGNCRNGTPDANSVLLGNVPAGDYRGLRFTLGVPFGRNHADPLSAAVPLDDSTMHWHWRSGYKFLRAGFASGSDGFWIHLGSAGCEGTVQNITGCRFPNRVTVELPDWAPGDPVLFDFDALLAVVDTGDGEPGDCSSGPAEEACRAPFLAFGLDFETGASTGEQRLFRVASR